MLKFVVGATTTLKAFLEARSRGAPPEELKRLRAADEAARDARTDVVVAFKPADRERNGVNKD
jgi:hypothetical protein